ncbi:nucleotide-binding protein-like protein [Paenibacillus mucilaginosus 3016]|uniref:Nucleotide-binding protein-like protein n=1 Tax=Paenibacillus mucilaginosus 3016 TaxID=1116391 RepID=H6NEX2_9BACL|nr:nucleotide-binding protein-like protein [Paenibacillus mucilaginosus 3016]
MKTRYGGVRYLKRHTSKPCVFIGSARESIAIASTIHKALSHFAQVSPWYAGTFHAMHYTMDDLEARLAASDFAVFVFSPDDLLLHRGKLVLTPRDNTVFEMGLFWGKLKRGRVFFVVPEYVEMEYHKEKITEFHLMSDLQGLTLLRYEVRTDGDLHAAVSVACMEIGARITEAGKYEDPVEALQEARAELEQNDSLHHFFLHFVKDLMTEPDKKYEFLYDALRSAYQPIEGYRVVGAAVWKARGNEGLEQVAGNVGRNKFYPFTVNDDKRDAEGTIVVVDAFLNGLEKVVLLSDRVVKTYLLCYPVGKDLMLVLHVSGKRAMSPEDCETLLQVNHKLMGTINHLFGGESS